VIEDNKLDDVKIVFSGGGTLGPVTPLLAIREAFIQKYPHARFIWVGSSDGPERTLLEQYDIPYFIISAGKWRRYFSLSNFFDFFKIIVAFFQSLLLIWQEKPDLLISAGGFISVPLHWAGWILGVPSWIHQQDVAPGLANRLMAPAARKITVALADCVKFFSSRKTEWLGNPARSLAGISSAEGKKYFGLPVASPVIFVVGGGTGSARLNQILTEALPAWPKDWQVIHLVGKERPQELSRRVAGVFPNYHVFDFFTKEMKYAYAAADVVVARAGFNTITELALLSKPAILLPKEGHQESNAQFFASRNAALIINEKVDSGLKLAQQTKEVVLLAERRRILGRQLHQLLPIADPGRIVKIVEDILQ